MKNVLIFLIVLNLITIGCASRKPVDPHPTPIVTDTDLCITADQHLQDIGCIPKGKPYTKKGKSFTQFCVETHNNGIFLNPKCLASISTCEQMDVCTNTISGE
jgi:hypothetical protein